MVYKLLAESRRFYRYLDAKASNRELDPQETLDEFREFTELLAVATLQLSLKNKNLEELVRLIELIQQLELGNSEDANEVRELQDWFKETLNTIVRDEEQQTTQPAGDEAHGAGEPGGLVPFNGIIGGCCFTKLPELP